MPSLLAALQIDEGWYAGWGTLAFVNAGLAQSKNRSGTNWFLASLVLGPVATACLTLFCDKLPEPPRDD